MKKLITFLVIYILVTGCMNQKNGEQPEHEEALKETEEPELTEPEEEPDVSLSSSYQFAPFNPIPVTITGAEVYPLEPDNLERFSLTAAQIKALHTNGVVVVPSRYDQFYSVYQNCKKNNIPIFVTTDAVLHTYHILYDYTLRILETEYFYQDALFLTQQMADISVDYYEQTGDRAALKNVAYFCVAGKLLDETFVVYPEAQDIVDKELESIRAHQGFSQSPIFGYKEDYSQYVPRGHYTRSEVLAKYFKALMWYGRIMFRLKSEEETKQALYTVKAIKDTNTLELWDKIYEPTVFFVGKTDDLNVYEYTALAEEIYGESFTLSDLQDAAKLSQFIEKAWELRDPRINANWVKDTQNAEEETKGFKFMGQRFIPDSYMFRQLVYDKVGTVSNPRIFPKGLDVMAVLGSERALQHLESEKQFYNYSEQMEKLREEFSGLKETVWTQNLYWTWLYCLLPLLEEKDAHYPPFMQSAAWTDKELNTALGSWTELRHDTILYAKQSYTLEATAMPPQPELTKGYVEPNPYVYARLASLARMMREGLEQRTLLLPEYSEKLETLENLLLQLKIISEKELSGQSLTEEEYRTIWNIGYTLESLVTFETAVESEVDKSVAIIADVHTDVNTGKVLEEGVGDVFVIFVVVKIEERIYVVQGGVFSYYEFVHPMSDRLTDEQWQAMEKPPLPEWTDSFIIQ
ncbi:MAG: DUF3160 domain-containing protein [Theionarchaea archaeon]|nr:DUF3160 domain-containing protein [Theionarchaea archaeon]